MSELRPIYEGKPKGGAGLGQGPKKKKETQKVTFSFDLSVADITKEYSMSMGFGKGTMLEFVEIAILDLHKQFQELLLRPGLDTDTYANFEQRKEKLFKKLIAHDESKGTTNFL